MAQSYKKRTEYGGSRIFKKGRAGAWRWSVLRKAAIAGGRCLSSRARRAESSFFVAVVRLWKHALSLDLVKMALKRRRVVRARMNVDEIFCPTNSHKNLTSYNFRPYDTWLVTHTQSDGLRKQFTVSSLQ